VWDRPAGSAGGPPDDLRALAAALGAPLAGSLPADPPIGVIEAPLRFDPRHVRRVYYVLYADGVGHCR
jgi:hypothetical protein